MCFFSWLEQKENGIRRFNNFISIIASFFAVLGVIIAIILLIISINQISIAAKNIRAGTIYSIAKDGRELRKEINKMVKNGEFNYGYVFNYVHSVWHQKRLEILDDRMWIPIENEVCLFLRKNPEANYYWNEETRKLFDADFVEYIEKIGEKCGKEKGG